MGIAWHPRLALAVRQFDAQQPLLRRRPRPWEYLEHGKLLNTSAETSPP